jgi:hypothetical protein
MWLQPKQASSAFMAVVYITAGSLITVWTVIYYIYLNRHGVESDTPYLTCAGFFFSGLVLIVIGLTLGHIGRAARQAEVTPQAIVPPVATAAAVAPTATANAVPANPPTAAPAPPVGTAT